MDISTSLEDKKYYVVDVSLADDTDEYIVTYADGHQVKLPFTVHNFNAEIYRMRSQFLESKDKYVEAISALAAKTVNDEIKTLLFSLVGVVLTTNMDLPVVMKTILILTVVLLAIRRSLNNYSRLYLVGNSMEAVEKTEEFIEIMDRFKIEVVDPLTNKKEDWFWYNLSKIEPKTNVNALKLLSLAFTPEIKEEEGEKISKLLLERHESISLKQK